MKKLPVSLNVKVTEDHIKSGQSVNITHCAVALAIKDLGFKKVEVDGYCAYVDSRAAYTLPASVAGFIEDFDEGKDVKPIEFTMYRPDTGEDNEEDLAPLTIGRW